MRFLFAALFFAALGLLTLAFPFDNTAPSSLPGVIRGDIVLTYEQEEYYFGKGAQGRTGNTWRPWFWDDATVVYTYSGLTVAEEVQVELALRVLTDRTCMRFIRRTNQPNYVVVTREPTGCWSWVGRIGGAQQLNLGPGCMHDNIIWHEFIHAIGFFHMQSATDRDNFVQVMWNNITPGHEHNFDMVNPDHTSQFGVPYDLQSVMHYPPGAFSVNGQPTLVPRAGLTIGPNNLITARDATRINNMYCP